MNSSDKEIQDLKFESIMILIKSNQEAQSVHNGHVKDALDRIETQTIKTNGRVTKLENWRWKIIGISIGVSSILVYIFN
jgi:hypothetical protein